MDMKNMSTGDIVKTVIIGGLVYKLADHLLNKPKEVTVNHTVTHVTQPERMITRESLRSHYDPSHFINPFQR